MNLPPRYGIKDYLRQQHARHAVFSSDLTDDLLNPMFGAYRSGRARTETLRKFAADYEEYLLQAGCFGIKRDYIQGSKVAPYKENAKLTAYSAAPVSLGQGTGAKFDNAYLENAILLQGHVASFGRKKALLGHGPVGIALTQHLLERVYERTEVDHREFAALIERELTSLLRAVALAEVGGFWIQDVVEREGGYRYSAVPYSNGLILLNVRLLLGSHSEGELGFRLEVPSGRTETPFLNRSLILDDLGAGQSTTGHALFITVCGITYFNLMDLDKRESDYYYSYKALMEEVGDDALDALAHYNFAPTLPHEQHPQWQLQERFEGKVRRLRSLLNEGWLKPKVANPMCLLLPYDP